jgi:hypothetical protein
MISLEIYLETIEGESLCLEEILEGIARKRPRSAAREDIFAAAEADSGAK